MHLLTVCALRKLVPFLLFSTAIYFCPSLYNQRITTGIFRNDYYLIWILGASFWIISLAFSGMTKGRLAVLSGIGCLYLVISFLTKGHGNENSLYVVITVIALLGIIQQVRLCAQLPAELLIVILSIPYLHQIMVGYAQAFESNWTSLSIHGGLFNSGFFGNYLVSFMPLLLAFVLFDHSGRRLVRIIFQIIFYLSLVLVVATMARAAIVGLAAACFYLSIPAIRRLSHKARILFLISVATLALSLLVSLYLLKPDSANGRLTIYRVSLNIWKDHLFTGTGPNSFPAKYNLYQSEYFSRGSADISTQLLAENTFEAFNSLLQIGTEYGLAGIVILGAIVYQFARLLKKRNEENHSSWIIKGSVAGLIAIFVSSLFSNPFHVTPVILFLCFHLGVVLSPATNQSAVKRNYRFLTVVTSLVCMIWLLRYIQEQRNNEKKWFRASEIAMYDGFQAARSYYEELYPRLKNNSDFLYNYGAEAIVAGYVQAGVKILNESSLFNSSSDYYLLLGDGYYAMRQFENAEKYYLRSIYTVPSHLLPKYQLVQLYRRWGKKDKEKWWTRLTLDFPVKVRSSITDDIKKELAEESSF